MKKLFTILAAALFSVSMMASTVDDLATISDDFSFSPTAKLEDKTLYESNQILCIGGCGFKESSLQIKNNRYLVIKVAANATVTVSFNERSDHSRSMQLGSTANATNYGTSAYSPLEGTITDGGLVYITASSDLYLTNLSVTFPAQEADHSKATVKSISVNGTKLGDFDPEKDEYDIELPYGTTEIPEVTAVAGDDATIVVTQATSVTGEATVTCTSYDKETTIKYTLNFSVKEAGHDATLKSITIGGVALADFAAETTEYEYATEYDATEYPTIVVTANDANAIAMVNQPETFPGTVTIDVYAEDGETNKTYTITFTIETEIPIIRATHVDGTHANVKGSIGGTSEKSTQDNMKFGSNGHFWGITLAGDKTFQTGDSLVINLTTLSTSNTNFIGLYAEKEGTTLLWNTGITAGVIGDNSVILPEALNGQASFYIVRPSDENKWNGSIKSISVYRKDKGWPTAVDNTEDGTKAVKFIENGQMFIKKNGIVYNAQGAIVK